METHTCPSELVRQGRRHRSQDRAFQMVRARRKLSMNPKFTYNDMVIVRSESPLADRRGEPACIVGITDPGGEKSKFYDQFPPGIIYTIEFENGASASAHESWLDREVDYGDSALN
jgi:hypothetical protein